MHMHETYAKALLELVNRGTTPKEAVASIRKVLSKSGKASLFPSIAKSVARLAGREMRMKGTVLVVAKEADAAEAKERSGEKDAKVRIDPTIIGGWRLESAEELRDASYKRALLEIYQRAIDAV